MTTVATTEPSLVATEGYKILLNETSCRGRTPWWVSQDATAVLQLGALHHVVLHFLYSGPNSNMYGIYLVPLIEIAHRLRACGQTVEKVRQILADLGTAGLVKYDCATEVVWVVGAVEAQYGSGSRWTENQKHVTGALRALESLPECGIVHEFAGRYGIPFGKGIDTLSIPNRYPAALPVPSLAPARAPADARTADELADAILTGGAIR